jgi:polysaccharide transporter, PST family
MCAHRRRRDEAMPDQSSERAPPSELAARASAGVRWGAFSQGTQQIVRFGVQIALTRLLSPTDFGTMAVALVIINVCTLVGGLGLAQALVQRPLITERDVAAAFTANIIVNLVLVATVCVTASSVAIWLGEPDLRWLLWVLSGMLLLRALEGVPNAMLVRRLLVRDFVLSSMVATIVGAIVGVSLAIAGFGLPALAGMAASEAFVATSLAWVFAIGAEVWRPRISLQMRTLRELIGFGVPATGTRLLLVAQGSADILIVGGRLGATQLGRYSLGYRCLLLPLDRMLDALGGVLEPVLATLQDDRSRFQEMVLRAERHVCALYVPLVVGMGVVAHDLVLVLFGPAWLPAVPVLQVLSFNGPRPALTRLHAYACEELGYPRVGLLVVGAQLTLGIPASLVAANHGIVAVAIAFTTTGWLTAPLSFVLVRRVAGLNAGPQLFALRGILVASVAMAVTVLVVQQALSQLREPAVALAAELFVGGAAYLVVLGLLDGPLLKSIIRDISRRRESFGTTS